jgi:hypothetical protein
MVWVRERELYLPSDRRLSAKWLPTFADRGCHMVSVMDPYGRIHGFLDRSRFFYQVAPQLYSRGWVGPFPDPLLFFCAYWCVKRKYGIQDSYINQDCLTLWIISLNLSTLTVISQGSVLGPLLYMLFTAVVAMDSDAAIV